ncbi:YcdB/YcdC domain-containing protein [Brevibacillus laterosporus]|nr:YcdB/YcdC domain-containing protein [Brevibacillus laterosporus]
MGVDSFDKKIVQEFRAANLDMLPFTPQMEAKIWEGIRQKKLKNRRVFTSLSLACGFALVVLGTRSVWIGETSQVTLHPVIIKHETELKGLSQEAKKTVQSLYKFAPYLQNGLVTKLSDNSDRYDIYMKEKKKEKGEGWSAEIRIDRTSGELEKLDVLGEERNRATKSVLIQRGTAILQEMLGEKSNEYKQIGLDRSISFQRFVNKIPVSGDYIGIDINEKGELDGYWRQGSLDYFVDKAAFPLPSKVIPSHELGDYLQKYIKLRYVEHFDPKNDRPILEYTPGILDMYNFDAITGKPIYHTYYDYDPPTLIQMNPPNTPVIARNQQEAELLIKREYEIKEPLKVYSNNWDDHKQRKEENEAVYQFGERGEYTVFTELSSGRVLQITKYTPKAKGKISKENAKEKAIRFLAKYLDPWDKEVQLTYSNEDEYSYKFRFFKSYQGIPVLPTVDSYISYSVKIDSATGEGISFIKDSIEKPYVPNKQVKLPDRNAIMSTKVGASEWLRHNPVKLVYEFVGGGKDPRLVYQLVEKRVDKNVFIDATTGKAVFVDR